MSIATPVFYPSVDADGTFKCPNGCSKKSYSFDSDYKKIKIDDDAAKWEFIRNEEGLSYWGHGGPMYVTPKRDLDAAIRAAYESGKKIQLWGDEGRIRRSTPLNIHLVSKTAAGDRSQPPRLFVNPAHFIIWDHNHHILERYFDNDVVAKINFEAIFIPLDDRTIECYYVEEDGGRRWTCFNVGEDGSGHEDNPNEEPVQTNALLVQMYHAGHDILLKAALTAEQMNEEEQKGAAYDPSQEVAFKTYLTINKINRVVQRRDPIYRTRQFSTVNHHLVPILSAVAHAHGGAQAHVQQMYQAQKKKEHHIAHEEYDNFGGVQMADYQRDDASYGGFGTARDFIQLNPNADYHDRSKVFGYEGHTTPSIDYMLLSVAFVVFMAICCCVVIAVSFTSGYVTKWWLNKKRKTQLEDETV